MSSPRLRSVLFAIALLATAVGIRAPWFHRAIWNLDEGSTFTMAQQILAGDVLYRDAVDQRNPLMPYLKAAIFAVAGDWNAYAVHFVVALLLGVCAIALWRIARRLGDERAGVLAAIVFTILSYTFIEPDDAMSASTGWFLVIFSVLGFAAFAAALARPGFFRGLPAGFLFGCAILCKQPALLDFATTWVLLALLAWKDSTKRGAYLQFWIGSLAGAAVPILAFFAYFTAHGALHDFIYYAYTFNTTIYVPAIPRLQRLATMGHPFALAWTNAPVALFLGVPAAAGLLFAILRSLRRQSQTIPVLPWLILGWTAAGIIAAGLSGRAFSHYSTQVEPGLSLACGWILARLMERGWRPGAKAWARWAVAAVIIGAVIACGFDAVRRVRRFGTENTLDRSVGHDIAAHSSPSERVFVWGCFPELYFYAERLPASRFVYTNFVSGLLAWTNLDPLIDTRNLVVPHAWDQIRSDFSRHSPGVIVDIGSARGNLKYPLNQQPVLWKMIRTGFAEVSTDATRNRNMRIFRKLQPTEPVRLEASLPENREIKLSGFFDRKSNEPPRVHVQAPAGTRRVELYVGAVRAAAIQLPGGKAEAINFFIDEATTTKEDVRAVVEIAGVRSVSPSFDFGAFDRSISERKSFEPRLHLGPTALAPLAIGAAAPAPLPSPLLPDTWRIDAPDQLEYPCPANLTTISFVHGPYPVNQTRSDGYDVLVELHTDLGPVTRIYQRRMLPRVEGRDQLIQTVKLDLPPHESGRLVFRFLAGKDNIPDFDWICFGQLHGNEDGTDGPILRMGEIAILPTVALAGGKTPIRRNANGAWLTHSPSLIEWPRPSALNSLHLEYGIEEGAYTAVGGHSDGATFTLDLVDDHGDVHPLFSQLVAPFNHPEHRGTLTAKINLPPGVTGKLILRVGPGPNSDDSWDWAWVRVLKCDGPGPDIALDHDRYIMPESSRVVDLNGGPSKRDSESRWGAHADAELTYHRPVDLTQVIFRYGLAEGADRDENGKQRSDGVDVVVEFQPILGPAVELFRRTLDPFHQTSDRGEQTSTVMLPPGQEGRLTFRLTPGASGSNAFDWGFWGPFEGKTGR